MRYIASIKCNYEVLDIPKTYRDGNIISYLEIQEKTCASHICKKYIFIKEKNNEDHKK